MTTDTLLTLGAARLARAIAMGEAGALEVVEAHIGRLENVNPKINAITARRYDLARQEARAVDQRRARGEALPPLAGVPITVKDAIDVAGLPSTFGLPWRRDIAAERDDGHVARLRAAGAIVLAKSNVAHLLMAYTSENPLHGRTLHPERADRAPGGSSGGEAALVASGASALGVGTDIGGSLRIPAHACGIAGFKPTAGRCNDPGRYSMPAGQIAIRSQIGPIARHVDDLVLALALMQAGPDDGVPALGDPFSIDVGQLRIGWFDDDGLFAAAPAARRAVREAADALRRAGAQVQPVKMPGWAEGYALTMQIWTGDGGAGLRAALRGGKPDASIKTLLQLAAMPAPVRATAKAVLGAVGQPTMAGFLELLGRTRVADHWPLVEALMDLRERTLASLQAERIDVLLAPPCSLPAFTHDVAGDLGTAGSYGSPGPGAITRRWR
ncbi:MAG: amidase [Burkholderiales bacterium]|nr:amidase [Burkholderiales bacterium]